MAQESTVSCADYGFLYVFLFFKGQTVQDLQQRFPEALFIQRGIPHSIEEIGFPLSLHRKDGMNIPVVLVVIAQGAEAAHHSAIGVFVDALPDIRQIAEFQEPLPVVGMHHDGSILFCHFSHC